MLAKGRVYRYLLQTDLTFFRFKGRNGHKSQMNTFHCPRILPRFSSIYTFSPPNTCFTLLPRTNDPSPCFYGGAAVIVLDRPGTEARSLPESGSGLRVFPPLVLCVGSLPPSFSVVSLLRLCLSLFFHQKFPLYGISPDSHLSWWYLAPVTKTMPRF